MLSKRSNSGLDVLTVVASLALFFSLLKSTTTGPLDFGTVNAQRSQCSLSNWADPEFLFVLSDGTERCHEN